jgi:hypothetical protein
VVRKAKRFLPQSSALPLERSIGIERRSHDVENRYRAPAATSGHSIGPPSTVGRRERLYWRR